MGTDVGGTFTDLWVADEAGVTRVIKTPATKDLQSGVMDAVALGGDELGLTVEKFCARIERFGHGTTVGVNALLTGNGARTAILTTRGFADTLDRCGHCGDRCRNHRGECSKLNHARLAFQGSCNDCAFRCLRSSHGDAQRNGTRDEKR